MKILSRRTSSENGFTTMEVLLVGIALVLIVAIGCLVYYRSNRGSEQEKPVSFDTPTSGAIGPACSYMTTAGCFMPTDTRPLNKIREQGYLTARIDGKGYTDYEVLRGSAVNASGEKTKVIHVTHIDSIKGVGQKYK